MFSSSIMKKFEFFDHTADAMFRAYGKSVEERFTNAALAFEGFMFDLKDIEPKTKKKVVVDGSDYESLLYNWLEYFLFLLDAEKFIMHDVKDLKISKKNNKLVLTADVVGDKATPKYKHKIFIKAVTYNDMKISDDFVQVVVDI